MSINASASPRSTAIRYSSHAFSTLSFASEYGILDPGTVLPPWAQPIVAIAKKADNLFIAHAPVAADLEPARRRLQRRRKLAKRRASPCFTARQKGTEVLFGVSQPCQIDIG